jgi:tetratricopeptide (TPR) repeat protein
VKPENGARRNIKLALEAGKERDYKKAVRILEELISGPEAPAEAWLLLGRALHARAEYGRALVMLNDYIRLRPRDARGYLFAGRGCLCLGMPRRAVTFFRKARSINPDNAVIGSLLGIAYLKSRHSQLAVDTLQAVVESAPARRLPPAARGRMYRAYINALFIRGLRLCRLGEYDLGGQMLRFVLENGEGADVPLLRLELGRACREMDKLPEALEHYSRALDFSPADTRVRWYRCSILMALGDQAEALKDLEELRAADSALPESSPSAWNSRMVDLYMIRSLLG